MKTIFQALGLYVLAMATAARGQSAPSAESAPEVVEALTFERHVLQAISDSDRIEIVEHSHEHDFMGWTTQPISHRETVYQRVDLSSQKTAELVEIATTVKGRTDYMTACMPAPHYTFYFYAHGEKVDQFDVCFECGKVIWFGLGPPMEFFPRLASLVTSIGMQPKSNFRERARLNQGKTP